LTVWQNPHFLPALQSLSVALVLALL